MNLWNADCDTYKPFNLTYVVAVIDVEATGSRSP